MDGGVVVTRRASSTGLTMRGPVIDDLDIAVSYTTRENLVAAPGEPYEVQIGFGVYLRYDAAIVDKECDIQVQFVDGLGEEAVWFESADESIATVDENGVVTRVSDGIVEIRVRTPFISRVINVRVKREEVGAHDEFLYSLDNPSVRVEDRAAGLEVYRGLYALNLDSPSKGLAVHNPTFWLADYDFSALSYWNDHNNGGLTGAGGRMHGGILIAPQHVLFAKHFDPPVGTELRWLNPSGVMVSRTVAQIAEVEETDISVASLSAAVTEVDDGIRPILIGYDDMMAPYTGFYILGVASNQYRQMFPLVWNRVQRWESIATYKSAFSKCQSEALAPYSLGVIVGDSGQPVFLLGISELVLISAWWTLTEPPIGFGPAYHAYTDLILAAGATLDIPLTELRIATEDDLME